MSCALYLLCLDHTPHISSWRMGSVGHRLSDLEHVQQLIADRDALLRLYEQDVQPGYPAGTAMHFFAEHPKCRIGIRDEYGRHHPATAGSLVAHNHPITETGGCNAGCVEFPPSGPSSFGAVCSRSDLGAYGG